MPRYIDADALINDFDQTFLGNNARGVIRATIEYAPTADVVERKTGRWKCICGTDYWQYTYEHYRCSECGIPAEGAFRFCPNCGAQMDERREDAEVH